MDDGMTATELWWLGFAAIAQAIAAVGTLVAVGVSVWVAVISRRDSREDRKLRIEAEHASQSLERDIHRERLEYQRLADVEARALRQATLIDVELRNNTAIPENPQTPVLEVLVPNLSGRPFMDLVITVDTHDAGTDVKTVEALGPSQTATHLVVVRSPKRRDQVQITVAFTDEYGDRWRLENDRSLVLLNRRHMRYEDAPETG